MTKRERKKLITILITVSIVSIIILTTIFVVIYVKTDMFKSNKTLFFKYMSSCVDNINNVTNIINDENIKNNKYEENSKIKVNYIEKIGTTSENRNNAINNLQLSVNTQKDSDEGYNHKSIKLKNNNNDVMNIEYLQEGNNYGVKFADIFNEYLSVQNGEIKPILKNAGAPDELLDKISDTLLVSDENVSEQLKFNADEIETIKNKYKKIIESNFSGSSFSNKKNDSITIDGKSVNVNSYILNMTKEQLNNMYITFLETLKEDEIILGKIQYVQGILNKAKIILSEEIDLENKFKNKIDDTITEIKKNNIGNEKVQIVVYENLKQTVRIAILGEDYQVNFDVFQSTENYISFNVIDTGNKERLKDITLRDTPDKLTINIEDNSEDIPYKINVERSKTQNSNSSTINTNITYEKEDYEIIFNMSSDLMESGAIGKKETLQSENVQLDSLQDDQLKETVNYALQEINKKIEQIEAEINMNDIKNLKVALGITPSKDKLAEGSEISEAERRKFNSRFEFLNTEEEQTGDQLLQAVDIFGVNLYNLEVPSPNEIKVVIDRTQNNQTYVENLKKYIEDNKDKKYKLSIEYDDTTGLVKYITIQIIVEDD